LAGTVSSVAVKIGEALKPGQRVVTLIAMKMENEIVSEGYGKIKEIKVKENQSVDSGDTLIILE
jgi:acetyl-CoA/propionyl-CoA carboxylase biotin carboxyl carrier protein